VNADQRELFDAALRAYGNAHAPYSNFPVGAAVRSSSGRVFAGCNVENAAYPQGWCAEASAIDQQLGVNDVASFQRSGDAQTIGLEARGIELNLHHIGGSANADHAQVANIALSEESIDALIGQQFDAVGGDDSSDQTHILTSVGDLHRLVEREEGCRHLRLHFHQHVDGGECSDSWGC